MDHQITEPDLEFVRWINRKDCEHYWEMNEKGDTVILRSGRDKTRHEFDRIKGFKENSESD